MKQLIPFLLLIGCGMPFTLPGQPIRTTPAPPAAIRVQNDSLFKSYTNITLDWQLLVNGRPFQQGKIPGLQLLPGHPRTIRLPLRPLPPIAESYLTVSYHPPIRTRSPFATQTLRWKNWSGDTRVPAAGDLTFTDSNDLFTISSPLLHITFDKQTGWIQEYTVDHFSLLTDSNGLRPALPAPPHLQLFSTSTGPQMAIVRTEYTVPELSCLLHLSYTLNAAGIMVVEETLETDTTRGDSALHSIQRFGIGWQLPHNADSISWYGPANVTDSIPTIHNAAIGYAAPADTIVKLAATSVRWCDIHDDAGNGFHLTADSNLLQLQISPVSNVINIDKISSPIAMLPVYFHFAFKITPRASITHPPETSIMHHPAAKPI